MKLKMAKNSLFAVLLRSPWWYSVLIVLGMAIAARALLPEPYVVVGIVGTAPFWVIAAMSAWRQWKLPNPARVSDALARAGTMSWVDFSKTLEKAFVAQGYTVSRLSGPAADLQLDKNGAVTLVSCNGHSKTRVPSKLATSAWPASPTTPGALRKTTALCC